MTELEQELAELREQYAVAAPFYSMYYEMRAAKEAVEQENAKLIKRLSDQERHNSASRKSICEHIQQLEAQVKAFEETSR